MRLGVRRLRHRAQHAHQREEQETSHLRGRVHDVHGAARPEGLDHDVGHRVRTAEQCHRPVGAPALIALRSQ